MGMVNVNVENGTWGEKRRGAIALQSANPILSRSKSMFSSYADLVITVPENLSPSELSSA